MLAAPLEPRGRPERLALQVRVVRREPLGQLARLDQAASPGRRGIAVPLAPRVRRGIAVPLAPRVRAEPRVQVVRRALQARLDPRARQGRVV